MSFKSFAIHTASHDSPWLLKHSLATLRAMARRKERRKAQRETARPLQRETSAALPGPQQPFRPQPPWYEGTLLWGALGTVVAIVLVVVGAILKDLRWLLAAAWPFACLVVWAVTKGLHSRRLRGVVAILGLVIATSGLYWLYAALDPVKVLTPPNWSRDSANSQGSDLGLEFFGRDTLRFNIVNLSSESGRDPAYWFGLWNIDKPSFIPGIERPQPLQIPVRIDTGSFVFHNSKVGSKDVLSNPNLKASVRTGDRLFGVAEVYCFNCVRERAYYLYFKIGSGGWYGEANGTIHGAKFTTPSNKDNDEKIAAIFDAEVPSPRQRLTIPEAIK